MISLTDSEHALVDKVCLRGFSITSIDDFQMLHDKGIIRNNPKSPSQLQLPTIPFTARALTPSFTSLHIGKNAFFDDLTFSLESGHTLSSIEFSVRDPATPCRSCSVIDSVAPKAGHHNLNCQPIEAVKNLLGATVINLSLYDGIDIDVSNIRIYSIEINKTFVLTSPFASYYRPMRKLMTSFSGRLHLEQSVSYEHSTSAQHDVGSFYRQSKGKTGITIKLYDKSAQMRSKSLQVEEEYARLEITFKGYDKVHKRLGSNKVEKLTGSMINKAFSRFINENLLIQLEKKKPEKRKVIRNALTKYYQKGSKTWAHTVLLYLYDLEVRGNAPMMLSLDDLLSELDTIAFESKQSKSDAKRKLINACETISSVFLDRDSDKMTELIAKLSTA